MRLLPRLEYEQKFYASCSSYSLRVPKHLIVINLTLLLGFFLIFDVVSTVTSFTLCLLMRLEKEKNPA